MPEYVAGVAETAARSGILSWSMQLTDDKNMAIVHLVAANPRAFDAVLNDKRPEIRAFTIGKDSKDTIEKEMQKYRKDFSLATFQVVAQ